MKPDWRIVVLLIWYAVLAVYKIRSVITRKNGKDRQMKKKRIGHEILIQIKRDGDVVGHVNTEGSVFDSNWIWIGKYMPNGTVLDTEATVVGWVEVFETGIADIYRGIRKNRVGVVDGPRMRILGKDQDGEKEVAQIGRSKWPVEKEHLRAAGAAILLLNIL